MMHFQGGNQNGGYSAPPVQQHHQQQQQLGYQVQGYGQQGYHQQGYQQSYQQQAHPEQYHDPVAELDRVVNASKNMRDGARSRPSPTGTALGLGRNTNAHSCTLEALPKPRLRIYPGRSPRHLAPEQRCAAARARALVLSAHPSLGCVDLLTRRETCACHGFFRTPIDCGYLRMADRAAYRSPCVVRKGPYF